MKKFWEWMERNNFCHSLIDGRAIKTKYEKIVIPTKQMLIGYMIEYLLIKKNIFIGMPLINNNLLSVEDYYNILKKEIEKW